MSRARPWQKKLYEDLGFSETGRDEDEIEMELTFR